MKRLLTLLFLVAFTSSLNAQDTFSIVAVDTLTGEVGSAGASCINGSIIISDVHPGIGAVHTQSYWLQQNQDFASYYMEEGLSPAAIIDTMIHTDAEERPAFRQYGVVRLNSTEHAAAFTGDSCMDYKGHIVGPYYAIQGNILLGRQVLENMEANFLKTAGPLADRLMAAMQGANIPGADTRCLQDGTSSKSAFIRVARPTDAPDALTLDINVHSVKKGIEPIDSLQRRYDIEKTKAVYGQTLSSVTVHIAPNPSRDHFEARVLGLSGKIATLSLVSVEGQVMRQVQIGTNGIVTVERKDLAAGVYLYNILDQLGQLISSGNIILE
jgi:uncharacterized Ntn-hydrolase superfamily protein